MACIINYFNNSFGYDFWNFFGNLQKKTDIYRLTFNFCDKNNILDSKKGFEKKSSQ